MVEVEERGDAHGRTVHLPFDAASASAARRLLGDQLRSQGCAARVVQDVVLVVHELVMNGVDHGRPDSDDGLVVFWRVQGALVQVSVRDAGERGEVAVRAPDADNPRGRGLAIVEALSQCWRVSREQGTEVSAWLRLSA